MNRGAGDACCGIIAAAMPGLIEIGARAPGRGTMRIQILAATLLVGSVSMLPADETAAPAAVAADSGGKSYGAALEGLTPSKLADVLAKPEADAKVCLEGRVEKVCQSQGCWLELRQGDATVHVRMAGHAFFVPKDSAGQDVILEGRVRVKTPKPDEVDHLKAEGASDAAASRVSIEATGVVLR